MIRFTDMAKFFDTTEALVSSPLYTGSTPATARMMTRGTGKTSRHLPERQLGNLHKGFNKKGSSAFILYTKGLRNIICSINHNEHCHKLYEVQTSMKKIKLYILKRWMPKLNFIIFDFKENFKANFFLFLN